MTAAPERKPAPFKVRVKAGPVAVTALGEIEVRWSAETVSGRELDTMPPGLVTVTERVPTWAIRLAGITTVMAVLVREDGVSVEVPTVTEAPDWKPVPESARVKPGPPPITADGLREVSWGPVMGMVTLLESDWLGVRAVMEALPGLAMRADETEAVRAGLGSRLIHVAQPMASRAVIAASTHPAMFVLM